MTRDQALAVLNLPESATPQEVQQAYERLVRRYPPEFHPDKFCQIDAAHRFLTSLPYRLERLFAPEKFQANRQGGLAHTLEPPAIDGEALVDAWHQQLLRSHIWEPEPPAAAKKRRSPSARQRSADQDDPSEKMP